jgi:hypothetical protein
MKRPEWDANWQLKLKPKLAANWQLKINELGYNCPHYSAGRLVVTFSIIAVSCTRLGTMDSRRCCLVLKSEWGPEPILSSAL